MGQYHLEQNLDGFNWESLRRFVVETSTAGQSNGSDNGSYGYAFGGERKVKVRVRFVDHQGKKWIRKSAREFVMRKMEGLERHLVLHVG